MTKVVIDLPHEVAARARAWAERQGVSVTKMLGDIVVSHIGRPPKRSQSEALASFLAGPLLNLSDERGRLPSREELYDDYFERLYRHHGLDGDKP